MFENANGEYPDTVGTVIMGEGNGGYLAQGTGRNIPELMKGLGKGMKEFKDASNDKNEDSNSSELKKD